MERKMSEATIYQEEMKFSYTPDRDVEVIRVIRTNLLRRGEGVEKDPIRRIEQFWSLDGELLWEIDPYKKSKKKTPENYIYVKK